jgi:hypothetical protein
VLQERFHFFNSFMFKKLIQEPDEEELNATAGSGCVTLRMRALLTGTVDSSSPWHTAAHMVCHPLR